MRTMTLAIFGAIALGGCYAEVSDDRDDRYRGEPTHYRVERVVDPVCGAPVDTHTRWHEEYQGRSYYFHDAECRDRFQSGPHTYVDYRVR